MIVLTSSKKKERPEKRKERMNYKKRIHEYNMDVHLYKEYCMTGAGRVVSKILSLWEGLAGPEHLAAYCVTLFGIGVTLCYC